MGICVKVAQRPLTPSVEVRILNPQPKGSSIPPTETSVMTRYCTAKIDDIVTQVHNVVTYMLLQFKGQNTGCVNPEGLQVRGLLGATSCFFTALKQLKVPMEWAKEHHKEQLPCSSVLQSTWAGRVRMPDVFVSLEITKHSYWLDIQFSKSYPQQLSMVVNSVMLINLLKEVRAQRRECEKRSRRWAKGNASKQLTPRLHKSLAVLEGYNLYVEYRSLLGKWNYGGD